MIVTAKNINELIAAGRKVLATVEVEQGSQKIKRLRRVFKARASVVSLQVFVQEFPGRKKRWLSIITEKEIYVGPPQPK